MQVQEVSLGSDGLIPLETRFLHDPTKAEGFVGAALSSNVVYFTKVPVPGLRSTCPCLVAGGLQALQQCSCCGTACRLMRCTAQGASGKWETSVAIRQEWTKLNSWILPACPPLITDILISLDDR